MAGHTVLFAAFLMQPTFVFCRKTLATCDERARSATGLRKLSVTQVRPGMPGKKGSREITAREFEEQAEP
jgi:hypothetical protein